MPTLAEADLVMKLSAAATHFDRIVGMDAYGSGASVILQTDDYNGSLREGLMNTRRNFSTGPGIVIPPRGALNIDGDVWIFGVHSADYFFDKVIRVGYQVVRSDGLVTIQTASQLLAQQAGQSAYANRLWLKEVKDVAQDSDAWGLVEFFFNQAEDVATNLYLTLGNDLYYSNDVYDSAAGFHVAQSLYFDEGYGMQTLTYTPKGSTYDPVNDALAQVAKVTIPAINMRFQNHYRYRDAASDTYQRGDQAIVVRQADIAQPKQSDTFTMNGDDWRVLDFTPDDDCWLLHVRLQQ